VSATSAASEAELLPILYVSPTPNHPKADQTFVYRASICDGSLYEEKVLVARVNLPNGYDLELGQVAKIEVSH